MHYSLAVLVVLYNKTIVESKTLDSLKKELSLFGSDISLVIWNNGPNEIELDYDVECDIKLVNDINNRPLSAVYNFFIDSVVADKYVLLDDDSELQSGFMERVSKVKPGSLGLPIVNTSSGLAYPLINNKAHSNLALESMIVLSDADFIKSIGSGLVITYQVIISMKERFGTVFDERFVLYGVDTTFFINLKKLNFSEFYVYGKIFHSLSKEEGLSEFRIKEFTYSYALIARYYLPFPKSLVKLLLVSVIKILSTSRYNSLDIKHMFIAYFSGKHYRVGQ